MGFETLQNKENKTLNVLSDKTKLSRANEKTADKYLWWVWDRMVTNINPRNWWVEDFSQEKDFKSVYAKAKNKLGDKSEFLRNGKRFSVDITRDNRESAEKQNKNFWREYKNYLLEKFWENEVEKRYNDALDLHYKYGNPKINLLNDGDDTRWITEYENRSSFSPGTNSINIYFSQNGKLDKEFMFNNYKQEMLHSRQFKDLGKKEFYRQTNPNFSSDIMHLQNLLIKKGYKLSESIKKDGTMDGVLWKETQKVLSDMFKSEEAKKYFWDNYSYKLKEWQNNKNAMALDALRYLGWNTFATSPYAYMNPRDIEFVHNRETKGIDSRYERDYELEENPRYKRDRLEVLQKYVNKLLKPYKNQEDIRVVQRALYEQWYKIPNSLKKDWTFDGIRGKECGSALSDWQLKNQ